MAIALEKIEEAKELYKDEAIHEIVKYFGLEDSFNEQLKSCSCPWHVDKTPSFIWNDKNNSFHCFAKETEVITRNGVMKMGDIVNQPVEIINGNGEWETVFFRNCGKQKLLKLTLTNNTKIKEIYATPEHEWIVRGKHNKIQTKDLKPNNKLERMWYHENDTIIPDIEGLRHGFIYGDGNRLKKHYYARICDEKKYNFCKKIFDVNIPSKSILKSLPNCLGVVCYKTNYDAKSIPSYNCTKEYLLGFLAGYFVADGNCTADTVQIHSAKYNDLLQIKHIFTLLGIPTYSIGKSVRKKGKDMGAFVLSKDSDLYALRIVKSAIPKTFYVSEKKPKKESIYKSYLGWKVVSVEETTRFEDVYCCETSTHSFVLDGFILTGNCFSCNRNYDILNLYMQEGLSYRQAVEKLFRNVGFDTNTISFTDKIKGDYRYPKHIQYDRTNVEQYFANRHISKHILDMTDTQSDERGNAVFHFYNENDRLLTVKYRLGRPYTREDKQKGIPKCWHQKDADHAPILFNMNRVNPNEPLLICEGETDTLSAIEAGYSNAVSIPSGCANMQWIEYNWDWLENFDKIVLWFDDDEAGIKARQDACHRLGTWRTYYVETHEEHDGIKLKDINEILIYKGKDVVLNYINKPFEIPIEDVMDLSQAEDFNIENVEGLYTGIKDLDNQIYKLIFGTVNIITGRSGSGKSSLVNQIAICQAVQQGYDVFVFSGELPAPILRNWVEVNMIGREHIMLKENHVRVLDSKARETMANWYKGKVLVYDDSQDTSAKAILNKMEEMARKRGTKVFLIDNLMMVDLECSEEARLEAEKTFVKDLIMFAKKFNVLVFLVAHPRKISSDQRVTKEDIAGSGNIVNLAHTVFSVHRYTQKEKDGELNFRNDYVHGKEPKEYDTVVEVLKNRITGLLPSVELYFDYNSYRFYREPSELWFRYGWDKRDTRRYPIPTTDPNNHKKIDEGGNPF